MIREILISMAITLGICALLFFMFFNKPSHAMIETSYENNIIKKTYSFRTEEKKLTNSYPVLIFKNNDNVRDPIYGEIINKVINEYGFIGLLNPIKENCVYIEDFLHEDYEYYNDTSFSRFDIFYITKSLELNTVNSALIFKKKEFIDSISDFLDSVSEYNSRRAKKIILNLTPEHKKFMLRDISDYNEDISKKIPLFLEIKY